MLTKTDLFRYGFLGLPTAFVGLPIYIYAPKFYSDTFEIPVLFIGIALLLARSIDTFQDPFIGYYSDKFHKNGTRRKTIIGIAIPVLVIGFVALFHPPHTVHILYWFMLAMIIVYTAYSAIIINYYSLAIEYTKNYNQQTLLTAGREACGLIGVLLAALIPYAIHQNASPYGILALILALLCSIGWLTLKEPKSSQKTDNTPLLLKHSMKSVFSNSAFKTLLLVFFLNGIAASIPASLVLFFIDDVIQANSHTGYFLATYFLAGAMGMPLWVKLAQHMGKKRSWLISMLITICTFVWASTLSSGDIQSFYIISLLSGMCFGADLALPPSMLSDIISHRDTSSKYFGFWAFTSKLSLAFAGSTSLIILGLLGYQSGEQNPASLSALAFTYATLPCIIKAITSFILYKSTLDEQPHKTTA